MSQILTAKEIDALMIGLEEGSLNLEETDIAMMVIDEWGPEMEKISTESGKKDDQFKMDWAAHAPFMLAVSEAFAHGAKKYGPGNWQKGLSASRLFSAAIRHLLSWILGEDMDADGFHHLGAAGASIMMAYALRGSRKWNDRYKKVKK